LGSVPAHALMVVEVAKVRDHREEIRGTGKLPLEKRQLSNYQAHLAWLWDAVHVCCDDGIDQTITRIRGVQRTAI